MSVVAAHNASLAEHERKRCCSAQLIVSSFITHHTFLVNYDYDDDGNADSLSASGTGRQTLSNPLNVYQETILCYAVVFLDRSL